MTPQSAIRKHTPYFPKVIDIIVLCYLGHAPFDVRPRSNTEFSLSQSSFELTEHEPPSRPRCLGLRIGRYKRSPCVGESDKSFDVEALNCLLN